MPCKPASCSSLVLSDLSSPLPVLVKKMEHLRKCTAYNPPAGHQQLVHSNFSVQYII